nr:hypothetical protein [Natronococcus sp. AD5]
MSFDALSSLDTERQFSLIFFETTEEAFADDSVGERVVERFSIQRDVGVLDERFDAIRDWERFRRVPPIVRTDQKAPIRESAFVELERIVRRVTKDLGYRRISSQTVVTVVTFERRCFWMLFALGNDCASGKITGAVDRDEQSVAVDPSLIDGIPRPRTVRIGAWALKMRRIEHEPRAVEAESVEELNKMIEQPLNERLDTVPELPDRAQHRRLICGFADETPENRIETVLEFSELELRLGSAKQQPTHHLRARIPWISTQPIVHPLIES